MWTWAKGEGDLSNPSTMGHVGRFNFQARSKYEVLVGTEKPFGTLLNYINYYQCQIFDRIEAQKEGFGRQFDAGTGARALIVKDQSLHHSLILYQIELLWLE